MDKSAKKEKKGKKKKKERKNAKKEDKMTFSEALLAYQIQTKESMIERLQAEFKPLEEKHTRYEERNQRLRAEQAGHIKNLLDDAKAQDEELSKKEVVNREQVDMEIKQKWDYIREKRHLFEELQLEINHLVEQNVGKQRERDYWLQYKNVGSREHAKQIRLLQEEIKVIEQNFSEVDGYFKRQLEASKSEVSRQTKNLMDEKMAIATEDALKHVNLASRKPVDENKWLKKQIDMYRKEVQDLEETVHKIEQENLDIARRLYERRQHNIKLSRDVRWIPTGYLELPGEWVVTRGLQPKRDTLPPLGNKDFSMDYVPEGDYEDDSPPKFQYLLDGDENGLQDDVVRGPVEYKWLPIEGRAVPIHPHDPRMNDPENSCYSRLYSRQKWTITPTMRKLAMS